MEEQPLLSDCPPPKEDDGDRDFWYSQQWQKWLHDRYHVHKNLKRAKKLRRKRLAGEIDSEWDVMVGQLEKVLTDTSQPPLKVVVCGQTNTSKSTICNQLTQASYCKVAAKKETSAFWKIEYSSIFSICVEDGPVTTFNSSIELEAEVARLTANPKALEKKKVVLTTPNVLSKRMTIVDSMGTSDSGYSSDVAKFVLEEANCLLYVISARAGCVQDKDVEFFKVLSSDLRERVIVVISQLDSLMASTEEEEVESTIESLKVEMASNLPHAPVVILGGLGTKASPEIPREKAAKMMDDLRKTMKDTFGSHHLEHVLMSKYRNLYRVLHGLDALLVEQERRKAGLAQNSIDEVYHRAKALVKEMSTKCSDFLHRGQLRDKITQFFLYELPDILKDFGATVNRTASKAKYEAELQQQLSKKASEALFDAIHGWLAEFFKRLLQPFTELDAEIMDKFASDLLLKNTLSLNSELISSLVRDSLLFGLTGVGIGAGVGTGTAVGVTAGLGIGGAVIGTAVGLGVGGLAGVLLGTTATATTVGTLVGGPIGLVVGAGVGLAIGGVFALGALGSLLIWSATQIQERVVTAVLEGLKMDQYKIYTELQHCLTKHFDDATAESFRRLDDFHAQSLRTLLPQNPKDVQIVSDLCSFLKGEE